MLDDTTDEITRLPTWEARYRPFPAVLGELGHDEIMGRIADTIYAPEDDPDRLPLLRGWSGLLVTGDGRDGWVTISVPEEGARPEPWHYIMRVGDQEQAVQLHSELLSPKTFQDMIAALLAHLGLEGDLFVDRMVMIMKKIAFSEDQEEG